MKTNNLEQENLYKSEKTEDATKNTSGKQNIKTSETKTLKGSDTKALVGEEIDKINEIEEDFNSYKRKMLNKLMK